MINVCEILGTEYPIIQGAMARIAECNLAAAVSNGGGLGIIASGGESADWLRDQIAKVREMTDKPFGVNIMLLADNVEELIDVVCEEKVPVVTTGAGNPGKYMEMWKNAGIKVMPVVASVAMARMMERCGADAVIAEGTEAGGHIGEITTMVLVPQVVDAVNIPVVAAGGIADGRGFAAAFMLGASGVQMGTSFVATKESTVHDNYKAKIVKAKDIDTKVTGRSTGHPVRNLRNKQTNTYLKLEAEGAGLEQLEKLTLGGLRKAVVDGDVDNGSVMAGQSAGLVKEICSCKDLITKVMTQGEQLLSKEFD